MQIEKHEIDKNNGRDPGASVTTFIDCTLESVGALVDLYQLYSGTSNGAVTNYANNDRSILLRHNEDTKRVMLIIHGGNYS